jgi:hypothetical protein
MFHNVFHSIAKKYEWGYHYLDFEDFFDEECEYIGEPILVFHLEY